MEQIQVFVPLIQVHCTVKFEVLDASVLEEIAHDGDQLDELREDQYFMPHRQDFGHHPVQQFELARRHVDPLRVLVWVLLEELIGVVADLTQLHHGVA